MSRNFQQNFRILTENGPVGLREKRSRAQEITVDGKKLKIQKGWLREAKNDEALYHKSIKQALLISSLMLKVTDGSDPAATDDQRDELAVADVGLEGMIGGGEPVSTFGHRRVELKKIEQRELRERYPLIKYGKGCCSAVRKRWFVIEDGEMLLYASEKPTAKRKIPNYKMQEAYVRLESRLDGVRLEPKWLDDMGQDKAWKPQQRLKIEFDSRMQAKKSPMYLYPKDKAQLDHWYRSFSLARLLVSDNDRKAMRAAIGRAINIGFIKGWETLFAYYREIDHTRKEVKQMAMRLMRTDLSRGWVKLRLVNKREEDKRRANEDRKLWVARFMSERMVRLGASKVQSSEAIREGVITTIQEKFRRYRESKMYDREYPINPTRPSRMGQARIGVNSNIALEALSSQEVLTLALTGDKERQRLQQNPQQLLTKIPCYSELDLATDAMVLGVSDDVQRLTFAARHTKKSDWSNFVTLDRISAVALHAAPQLNAKAKSEVDDGVWCTLYGPRVGWGKRVEKVQHVDNKRDEFYHVFGTEKPPFLLPQKLRKDESPDGMKWVKVSIRGVDGFTIGPEAAKKDESRKSQRSNASTQASSEQEPQVSGSFICISVVGYHFRSQLSSGELRGGASWSFNGETEASIPIVDEDATAGLDNTTVGVEIYEEYEAKEPGTAPTRNQKFVGSMTMAEVFGIGNASKLSQYQAERTARVALAAPDAPEGAQADSSLNVRVAVSDTTVRNFCVSPELVGGGVHTSFFTSHRGAWFGVADTAVVQSQFSPETVANFVELELNVLHFGQDKEDDKAPDDRPYLSLRDIPMYYIRASMCGVTVVSPRLHRCKASWAPLLSTMLADPFEMRFNGHRLCVPLPPGYWSTDVAKKERPRLLIEVVKCYHDSPEQMSYERFFNGGGERQADVKEEVIYHTALAFDNMIVNQRLDKSVQAFMVPGRKPKDPAVVFDCLNNTLLQNESQGSSRAKETYLSMQVALRDRDYVKGSNLKPGDFRTVCVGDKAMMMVDEEILYPETAQEAKQRFVDDWKPVGPESRGRWPAKKGKDQRPESQQTLKDAPNRGCPLRDPAISSEWSTSGLSEVQGQKKFHFKPSIIPNYCNDIIPHMFVLPLTEEEFVRRRLPGVWPMILDDMAQHQAPPRRAGPVSQNQIFKMPVTHLRYTSRPVPVTVLATYPDGSCDVEVSPSFLDMWRLHGMEAKEGRKLVLPGRLMPVPKPKQQQSGLPSKDDHVVVNQAFDFQGRKMRLNQRGTVIDSDPRANTAKVHFDDGVVELTIQEFQQRKVTILPQLYRAVLQKVQLASLVPVHTASFHLYDAEFRSTLDYLRSPAPKGDANLRSRTPLPTDDDFRLAAGPLPPDASPGACTYDWKLHLRFGSESEMHKFVAMLRQCVRMEHFNKSSKMSQYAQRNLADVDPNMMGSPRRQMIGGMLEVLLVEARRLKPVGFQETVHAFKENVPFFFEAHRQGPIHEKNMEKCKATGATSRSTPEGSELSTMVNFRMKIPGSDGGEGGETVLAYKGQKVQSSSVVSNTNSPSWAMQEVKDGGFMFRTGQVDPDDRRYERQAADGTTFKSFKLEFEVVQVGFGRNQTIGVVQLDMFDQMGRKYLNKPSEPFHSIWLPLLTVKDGKGIPNKTGEIHIMTRWIPATQLMMNKSISMRSSYLKEIWPKVCARRVREPIYELEASYMRYNPNLARGSDKGQMPTETPPEYVRRHVEEMYDTEKHLLCIEMRQWVFWEEFLEKVGEEAKNDLGHMRLSWGHTEDPLLAELQELIEGGIPSMKRESMWLQLTEADAAMDSSSGLTEDVMKAAADKYQTLLEQGKPLRSEANQQMQEDAFHLASWETAVPVNPEMLDFHLGRLGRAQNVCTALAVNDSTGLAYCQSLLVVAFYMLLPQGLVLLPPEEKLGHDLKKGSMEEASAFWLLHNLISPDGNGAFKEYYGRPVAGGGDGREALCTGPGAMKDVHLLDCCLAHNEPELWHRFVNIGFQLSSVFYGAFMRLYATYMPTNTVFRFWDLLFTSTKDPKLQGQPRIYLVDLAFGVMKPKKAELMACQSALEVKDLLLGVLGSIYDMATVVEITLAAHRFLWGGAGIAKNAVSQMAAAREDLFQTAVAGSFVDQNAILAALCRERSLGRLPMTKPMYQQPQEQKGVQIHELVRYIIPNIYQALENTPRMRPPDARENRVWGMHRPMPLATRTQCEDVRAKAYSFLVTSLSGPTRPLDPKCIRPPSEWMVRDGLEPARFTAPEFGTALTHSVESWGSAATKIFENFSELPERSKNALMRDLRPEGQNQYDTRGTGFMGTLTSMLGVDSRKVDRTQVTEAIEGAAMSINDFLVALILTCKGNAGEKARALFDLYASLNPTVPQDDSGKGLNHIVPVSRVARSIKDQGVQDSMTWNLTAPEEGAEASAPLFLKVFNDYPPGEKNNELGVVVVPTLSPFMGANPNDTEPIHLNIWGRPSHWGGGFGLQSSASPSKGRDRKGQQAGQQDPQQQQYGGQYGGAYGGSYQQQQYEQNKQVIGDMEVAITWTPRSPETPEVGQLCVRLVAIRFAQGLVSEPAQRNPYVEVSTGSHKKIPRWDPRGIFANAEQKSWLTTRGAYGGHIQFEPSMKEAFRVIHSGHEKEFSHWRGGQDMGWRAEQGTQGAWTWNLQWGQQFSERDFRIDERHIATSTRKNVIDMTSVRQLVSCIVSRSMLQMTNRQAFMLADSAFNRQGAVPGILEAVLVSGTQGQQPPPTSASAGYANLPKLKQSWGNVVDVTDYIALEHEQQIQATGRLNLFTKQYRQMKKDGEITLANMGIRNAFRTEQTLWVRFVRGGDGERLSQGVVFDSSGRLKDASDLKKDLEVKMDLMESFPAPKDRDVRAQVTKGEFISCMLESPVLGESLRRLGAMASKTDEVKRPINLDVTIMDPHLEAQDTEFLDAVDAQQSVLLEVWDADLINRQFLGEAWLPPLAMLTKDKRPFVLSLQPYSEDGERGASREDSKKDLGDTSKDKNKKIMGVLHVEAAWLYPAYEMRNGKVEYIGKSEERRRRHREKPVDVREQRAVDQVQLHSGELTLEIIKAEGLRRADASHGRDCDPSVTMWIRNDSLGVWRREKTARTSQISNNRNPKWRGEFKESPFEILTGSYESRFPPKADGFFDWAKENMVTGRTRRHMREEKELAALQYRQGRSDELAKGERISKRFGQGLQLKFSGGAADQLQTQQSLQQPDQQGSGRQQPGQQQQQQQQRDEGPKDGSNHGVEVYMGDSIREFKVKLTDACNKEADHQRDQGKSDIERKYRDINIGYRHLVMVFVPPQKLQRLVQQRLTDGPEYSHAFNQALNDPNSWEPLDITRTFGKYPQYGFGRSQQPVRLRIVEASDSYKMINIRYKEFENRFQKPSYVDTNETQPPRCFGFAKYLHLNDGSDKADQFEWRPALLGPVDGAKEAPRLTVDWVFKGPSTQAAQMEKSETLLGPRNVKWDDYVHPQHKDLLARVKGLRLAGRSDWEIEVQLNKELQESLQSDPKRDQVPPITVDIIRKYLQKQEDLEAQKKAGQK